MSTYQKLSLLLVIGVAISSASCSSYAGPKLPPKKPVVPVSGQVLIDGKPIEGVVVALVPTAKDHGLYQYPSAISDEFGHLRFMTYVTNDGAPAGEYVATFSWPLPIEQQVDNVDKLKGLYDKPESSKFKVTIPSDTTVLDPFNLKLAGIKSTPLSKSDLKELKKELSMEKKRMALAAENK